MTDRQIELRDNTIVLRPLRPKDADPLFQAAQESKDALLPWMDWYRPKYTLEAMTDWIQHQPEAWRNDQAYEFAILDAGDGNTLGACGLNNFNRKDRLANLGYWVRTSQVSQGIATTATRLLATFAFEQLELNRLELFVAEGNTASVRVANKIGAICEGKLRQRIVVREQVYDAFLYSLLPADLAPPA